MKIALVALIVLQETDLAIEMEEVYTLRESASQIDKRKLPKPFMTSLPFSYSIANGCYRKR